MLFLKQNERKHCINFIIVELLVVVAVIMILITLLLPTLNKAREKGFRISCSGNLKSLGTFFQFYMDDWQHLPAGYYMTPNSKQIFWDNLLCLLYAGRKLTKLQAEHRKMLSLAGGYIRILFEGEGLYCRKETVLRSGFIQNRRC